MLTGILFLALILAVAVLITVDVVRTPTEAPADRHGDEPGRAFAGTHSGTGAHAFSREPGLREQPVPPAAVGARIGIGPVDGGSLNRPDQAVRAFDPVNRDLSQSAATEEAVRSKVNTMYVNLSRRCQALVERQLRLIESLEHGEQDQQRLAGLSKLNRIAMRMHRNSQNLLILVGQESATSWNQPVTLAHLVEAALSEIEDYARVSFQVQPDIAVRGPAVHDAVHLLVELIDNATSFSSADMPVHITGRILTSGGALIDITDQGIGMAAKEMAYANQQLDNPPAPDIDVPKWMGLLVVARLAARHGIRVRLNAADLGGLTALVWLPDEILTHYAPAAGPGRAVTEQRAATAAAAGLVSARLNAQDGLATGPDPAWSARNPQPAVLAEPLAAARLSGPAPAGDIGVVVPHAESQATMRGLPIFDEVESRWSRVGRGAPGPAAASSPAASSPAASGLPRRPSAPSAAPRAVPGTPPAPPNRPGPAGRRSWPVPPEETNPAGPDEP